MSEEMLTRESLLLFLTNTNSYVRSLFIRFVSFASELHLTLCCSRSSFSESHFEVQIIEVR